MIAGWREFWNGDPPIYASERHKLVHYGLIARDIRALLPGPQAVVLDHGCGEALRAPEIAAGCGRLYLCDAAPRVRDGLARRFANVANIAVIPPDDVAELPEGALDLVVANSLTQYLSRAELAALIGQWRRALKPGGRLVLADVLPRGLSPLTDAAALLRFGLEGGFASAAVAGLVRTALSDYRKLRAEFGLASYDEADILAMLAESGFEARRLRPNLGHNQARMAFCATRF